MDVRAPLGAIRKLVGLWLAAVAVSATFACAAPVGPIGCEVALPNGHCGTLTDLQDVSFRPPSATPQTRRLSAVQPPSAFVRRTGLVLAAMVRKPETELPEPSAAEWLDRIISLASGQIVGSPEASIPTRLKIIRLDAMRAPARVAGPRLVEVAVPGLLLARVIVHAGHTGKAISVDTSWVSVVVPIGQRRPEPISWKVPQKLYLFAPSDVVLQAPSQAIAPVPVPPAGTMLLGAILGLIGVRRRLKLG